MRTVNTNRVFTAWYVKEKDHKDDGVWTDGETIYSYSTALVVKLDDDRVVLNATSYSHTTGKHQTRLRELLNGYFGDVLELKNQPFGVSPETLKQHAEAATL